MDKSLFSSERMDWETPIDFFNELNQEFNFTLDPCCTSETAKAELYYTKEDDGLSKDWGGHTVFCNPPYGRDIKYWVEKCYEEGKKPNTTVVLLIPSRTDTKYFHDWILGKGEMRFIKGRLKFVGAESCAPFPSLLVVYR